MTSPPSDPCPIPDSARFVTDAQILDAVENLRDGFLLYDAAERVLFHNRRILELYPVLVELLPLEGRTMAELVDRVAREVVGGDDEKRRALIARRRQEWSLPAGSPYTLELVDGRHILVGERATADGGKVVIHTDVTAQKQAELRLIEAIESLDNGFVLIDGDDRVILANDPVRRMFPGQAPTIVPGASIRAIVEAGMRAGDYRNFPEEERRDPEAILRRHREGAREGAERQLPDGRWIVIHQARTPSGLKVGLRTDITLLKERERDLAAAHAALQRRSDELERMADELRAARERAEAADRAKTEFLAMVSHELRTPFTGILGMADLLADAPLAPEHRRYLDAMRRSTASLLGMLDQILDYSQVELGGIERHDTSFDPRRLAGEAAALFRALALDKRLDLRVEFAPDLPAAVTGDEGKTRQVLLNLVSNAIKFTDRGSVAIRVSAEPWPDGLGLRIEVADTGIGMSAHAQARLFAPFRQIDGDPRRRGGSGLGLSICKRLAEALGGTVGVESRSGGGSRFWFTTAVRAAPTVHPGEAAPPVLEGRALVVEDDPTTRLLLVTLLQRWGLDVSEAPDGAAALALLGDRAFAVLLIDANLPLLSGPSVVARLRAAPGPSRDVPVIGLSADSAWRTAAGPSGYVRLLAKPFEIDELRTTLAAALAASRPFAG
ncbi:PAS-domain containing protein [Stella sp.]|uniref:hybrid sensor histidine kinase/response regulator n=1 Tax=Stella sp. TaxID=2912054 RepID=UPI0035B1961A